MRKWTFRAIIAAAVLVWTFNGYLLAINYGWLPSPFLSDECSGPQPKVVPFRQGMTLCPGQSAIFQLEMMPATGPDL